MLGKYFSNCMDTIAKIVFKLGVVKSSQKFIMKLTHWLKAVISEIDNMINNAITSFYDFSKIFILKM